MFSWLRHRWRPANVPGFLVALLAIASQLALGAIVLPDEVSAREQSVAALDALSILCDSATPTKPDDAPKHHHRQNPDCAICPLGVALAMPAAVLVSGPALPPPSSHMADRSAFPPPARGPPAQPRHTPPSRGPPVLS